MHQQRLLLLQDNTDNSVNLFDLPLRFTAGNIYNSILRNKLTVPSDEAEVGSARIMQAVLGS